MAHLLQCSIIIFLIGLIKTIEFKEIVWRYRKLKLTENMPQNADANFITKFPLRIDYQNNPFKQDRDRLLSATSSLQINSLEHYLKRDIMEFLIGDMVWRALEHHVSGCHFVLATTDIQRPFVSHIIRFSTMASQPLVVVEGTRNTGSESLLTTLLGSATTVCRAFLVDLISDNDDEMFSFLDSCKAYLWPEAWVVIVGSVSKARIALHHKVLRNTHRPIYLGLQESLLHRLNTKPSNLVLETGQGDQKQGEAVASVYSRCLYCNNGYPDVRFLFLWPLGSPQPQPLNPFPNQFLDTKAHMFRIVTMPTFPYNDLHLDSDEPATTVTLRDCLDRRMLLTISSHLNFTYEVRVPWDMEWGRSTETVNWTGLVGTIQYNEADFTTTIAPTPGRNTIIDTSRAYQSDVLSVVSLKPQLLPQYLVIVRPFTVDVWMYLLLSIMIWGFTLWLLQKISSQYSGARRIELSKALFYSWAVMLEDPPLRPPKNITGQTLVGVWLIACLVVSTGFRAGLVPHLAVQSKTKPVDDFQDLTEAGGYKWGMEAETLTGVALLYFKTTTDPVVKFVYKYLERVQTYGEAFEKIIQGKYALVCWSKLSNTLVDSYYTDDIGNTPYYISKHGYRIVPYFGWGYGKGAPFGNRFKMVMHRLNEAGIVDYWTEDLMASRVRENRRDLESKDGADKKKVQFDKQNADDNTIKLRVVHLMGIFLVLFLGFGIAFLILIAENVTSNILN